ncbi:unnamed protein product [Prunus armeniaca]
MASKKIQSVPATRGKSVRASLSSGDFAGVITRSKAKAIFTTLHVTFIPTQAKAKDNISQADERNYQNEERSFSGSKNSRERSLSPVSDADSSTDSYHGSPPDDQHKKIASVSIGYGEAVTKLTKMVEEKDAQIASLINKWEAHQDKEPSQDTNKKGPHHEAESSEK